MSEGIIFSQLSAAPSLSPDANREYFRRRPKRRWLVAAASRAKAIRILSSRARERGAFYRDAARQIRLLLPKKFARTFKKEREKERESERTGDRSGSSVRAHRSNRWPIAGQSPCISHNVVSLLARLRWSSAIGWPVQPGWKPGGIWRAAKMALSTLD